MTVARATRCLLSQLHVNLLELTDSFPVVGEEGREPQPGAPMPDVADLGRKYIAEMHICAAELHKEEEELLKLRTRAHQGTSELAEGAGRDHSSHAAIVAAASVCK